MFKKERSESKSKQVNKRKLMKIICRELDNKIYSTERVSICLFLFAGFSYFSKGKGVNKCFYFHFSGFYTFVPFSSFFFLKLQKI